MENRTPMFKRILSMLMALAIVMVMVPAAVMQVRAAERTGNVVLMGDVNGSGTVDSDDAVYVLYHILFGEGTYPVNRPCDFDGSGAVDSDDAVYLLYYALFGEQLYPLFGEADDATVKEDVEVTPDDAFVLAVSEPEVLADSGTEMLFYVKSSLTIPAFELYLNGESTGVELRDDGDYAVSGDDIPYDGCYTGIYTYDLDLAGDVLFTARATVGGTQVCTNEVSVYAYYELTDEQINVMDEADAAILDMIEQTEADNTVNGDPDSLVAAILQKTDPYLQQLEQTGVISNLDYAEESYMYSWVYTETGIDAGYIIYDPYQDDDTMKTGDGDGDNGSTIVRSNTSNAVGSAVFMNNYPASHGWNVAYDNGADMLEAAGYDVTRVYSFTVEDFKNLHSYSSMILVNSHGQTHNGQRDGRPCICTEEEVQEGLYTSDLTQNRIMRVNGYYWIQPAFFEYYYGEQGMAGPVFYLGICRGYANEQLVSVLHAGGASAAMAYTASVTVSYDNDMMQTLIRRLIEGDTAQAALQYAKQQHGAQDSGMDYEWYEHPVLNLYGNADTTITSRELTGGDFEGSGNLLGWTGSGDTRLIDRLSGIEPFDGSGMAIISTGFGSMNDETTSTLSQTFAVPEDAESLTFSYNIVSEEPMEFVGLEFDDSFRAELLSTNGDVLEILSFESVNTSTWYEVEGVDFPGGDETAYHTRWITANFDQLSEYRGELVTLRFTVQDASDGIYDTAALIDSVSVS